MEEVRARSEMRDTVTVFKKRVVFCVRAVSLVRTR
jgi:hypothetical protein